ncbi:hypothetical protein ACSCBZ_46340 [Streptomyces niveiscabiei]|uniref:hypothetical protein n=1 Tax=Streptomyces niveiscabiei TaxID=164115 RepID=UPI0006EBAB5D|nr:hypothetical protein [Streptomyces niveiscabiei]
MSAAAATLYGVSGLLETVGLVVTVLDISRARRRLTGYLTRPRNVYTTDAGIVVEAFDARVVTNEEKTIEQRMADVEKWKQADLPQELDRRDKELMGRLERRFQSDLEAARKNVEDQYAGLREYVEGSKQKWWESYRGPILLVVGVLVGTAANFVALG